MIKTIVKYWRVTWVMIKNSYIRDSKITGHTVSKLLAQVVEILIYIVFFGIIFRNVDSLGGWSYHQVLFLYFYSRAIMLLNNMMFKKGFARFAKLMVRKGEYDFYVIKPINPMYLVSINNPQAYIGVSASFYLLAAAYSLIHSQIEIHLVNIIWLILLSVTGYLLYYFLNVICVVPTFWFIRLYTLKDIIYKANHFMRYPIGIFPNALKFAFMVIFPIAVVSYIPAVTIFYPPKIMYIVYMIVITIIFGFIANAFWKFGERHYSSASS